MNTNKNVPTLNTLENLATTIWYRQLPRLITHKFLKPFEPDSLKQL